MRHGAERFAAGDFTMPVRTSHSHEMDALATCLNVMAEQLDARLREVTRQRNETDAILRGMSEGVVAVDARLRVLRMNRAAAELFGVDLAEARGRNLIEVVRNAALRDTLHDALSTGMPTEREATILADSDEITVDIHASCLPDASGSVAVLHDTTRVRRLESMRRDFVANVSHELRTPITAILGFVETLADGAIDDPPVARRFLATIQRHSERLGRIVEDLLLLSKLDSRSGSANLDMVLEQVHAADVVRGATQAIESMASERGTRIEVQADDAIVFDAFPRFAQPALANLVDNAVKYSPPGATVRIVATQTDDATRIAVADEGPGIPAEHRARIFERFYRIDKGRSRELGGTGLGLAIVKHVMNVHGGSVELSSEEGRGSTFTLVFPRHAGAISLRSIAPRIQEPAFGVRA
jgi:two-component system phosphate regulon sensor histidine kinase PhoR